MCKLPVWIPTILFLMAFRGWGDVTVDNGSEGFQKKGNWSTSNYVKGFVGENYIYASGINSGELAFATFAPDIPKAGLYEVWINISRHEERAKRFMVDLENADGFSSVWVPQGAGKNPEKAEWVWVSLGVHRFEAGRGNKITISNEGADGLVVVDAIRLSPSSGK